MAKSEKPEVKTEPAATPVDPMAYIYSQIDDENNVIGWAIDILCNASMAIRYRQIFRAAAENLGEVGVYRLLSVMVQNTHSTKHNQLFMAACPAVSSARIAGKSLAIPEDAPPLPLPNVICHAIMTRASLVRSESERVRRYGNVRIV